LQSWLYTDGQTRPVIICHILYKIVCFETLEKEQHNFTGKKIINYFIFNRYIIFHPPAEIICAVFQLTTVSSVSGPKLSFICFIWYCLCFVIGIKEVKYARRRVNSDTNNWCNYFVGLEYLYIIRKQDLHAEREI